MPRRLPVGADVVDGGVDVRVWAPGHQSVEVVVPDAGQPTTDPGVPSARFPLAPESDQPGYWTGRLDARAAGTRYWLSVDGRRAVPDQAARFQPDGPHGASEVIDPSTFPWTDAGWEGPDPARPAIIEIHVGAYTREGTYDAARAHLPELADLGIGVVELMPLAEFPGRFGWGYDGVDLFAPSHLYGRPDDLRRYVDAAHALGIAVILDVVYNHLGPDGCYVREFSPDAISRRYSSDWGDTLNFDADGSGPMREFVIANAAYWVDEFHFDGLRLDATQQVFDGSPEHILAAITRSAREAARGRRTLIVAENEPNETRLVRDPSTGGYGMDALWNDDVHHSAVVALTGRNEAYYTDYRGTAQELVAAARHGYLFQGQRYAWQEKRRGTPALDLTAAQFVAYLENHDQVSNSARGDRVWAQTSPGRLRALTAYLLLGPARPMLFMGQEWAASNRFVYFADHEADLATQVADGRREFLRQFESLTSAESSAGVPDPGDPQTFEDCRLDHAERDDPAHAAWLALHRDLLALRRTARVFTSPGIEAPRRSDALDGAVFGEDAFVLRFFDDAVPHGFSGEERLLIVNLGRRVELRPASEPLLAPPVGSEWRLVLTTDDPRYGGPGSTEPETDAGWTLPAEAALVLAPVPRGSAR